MTQRDAEQPSLDGVEAEPASRFAAAPDGYERLWTPHRMAYIQSHHVQESDDECPFCRVPRETDEEALIVARGEHAFVVLNLYPYNTGHLLVCPYRHVGLYDEATEAEAAEIAALTQTAMRVLRATMRCDGFNIGMNQGRLAGAGIAEHLHQHVVPRWSADANFMPIVAGTKAMPRLLGEVRAEIAAAWPR
ncbi:MAG: HIT domain-containing protein [Yonghaparkia sp.]|nr:HIT domain-containing protein [Microcella sp.]